MQRGPKVVSVPQIVAIRDVETASLGVSHSAVITSNGTLFCGGTGTHGELGVKLDNTIDGWENIEAQEKKFDQ